MEKKKPSVYQHLALRAVVVDNPFFNRAHGVDGSNPRQITAVINMRESLITTLAARDRIDGAQVAAANKFRMLWEAAGGKGAGAIDYGRTHVDGGIRADPISETQINAAFELRQAHRRLGDIRFRLINRICGEGYSLHEFEPTASKRGKLAITQELRACLDILAEMWGIATRYAARK
jgi:hypothetical protein